MASGSFRFDCFALDPGDRRLQRDGAPVDVNARYLDALILLVGERGALVSKDRFLEEVWRGVPVTDEALTQCIKTLRRQLGDDAASPRFIETVPKHGYRFIAPVEWVEGRTAPDAFARAPSRSSPLLLLAGAGALGGGGAGLLGGVLYSALGVAQPGAGAASALIVLMCITMLVGLLGGAAVAAGIAAAERAPGGLGQWKVLGGAAGGFLVGGLVKLVGIDAFNLLFGQSPGEITGAGEGAMLGGAVGLAAWFASRPHSLRRSVAVAAGAGAIAGALIHILGGRLMAASLDLVSDSFAGSRLDFDRIGRLFTETEFGPVSRAATGALEGALFSACVIGAILLVRRRGP